MPSAVLADDPADVRDALAPVERPPFDPSLTRRTVAFWEKRAAADPNGAIVLRELAGAYLKQQRETGAIEDALRAEDAARRSLKALDAGNAAARLRLARSLLGQHRFPEALAIARGMARADPEARRLEVDILLEVGDIDEAARTLDGLARDEADPNERALRARIAEARGDLAGALGHWREARKLADATYDLSHEAVAWYRTMLGHRLIDGGKLDEGEAACRSALDVFPGDYRAMTGLAEAQAWRRDWKGAIAWAQKALDRSTQNPEVLRILCDAHAELGDAAGSKKYADAFAKLAGSFPRIYDRHWALFCADHGRDPAAAVALARADLALRHDAHAHDTLAWTCFKAGRIADARSSIDRALAAGAKDAPVLRHAAEIARAAGDEARARSLYAEARRANPLLEAPAKSPLPAG